MSQKVPFLNPNPLTQWSRPENIALVKIDGESSWALWIVATTHQTVNPTDLKEAVKMTTKEEIDAFSSKILHGKNENHAPGKQHACNDSGSEGR